MPALSRTADDHWLLMFDREGAAPAHTRTDVFVYGDTALDASETGALSPTIRIGTIDGGVNLFFMGSEDSDPVAVLARFVAAANRYLDSLLKAR